MGDYNLYKLILKSHPPDLFSRVVEAAGSLGYSCVLGGVIRGVSYNGADELKFGNVQAAQTHLFLEGGLITFARNCESCEDIDFLDFDVSFEPKCTELSLWSSNKELYKEQWSRVELAVDLRRLWNILSRRLKPLYGYATSAWKLEYALRDRETSNLWEQFAKKMIYYSLPPILFWANYFDWTFYESMDKTVFDKIPHRKFVMPEEYVCIYLAEFPWDEPQLAVLKNWKYQLVASE
jgi:hypothetical protein